ncbi:MAG TPA: hypothetical protein VEW94_03915 [Chloroflexia bacterium]|nr:hypothetical protein [Chloroflexia bacterium]
MKVKVTEQGVIVPKQMLEDFDEVEIRREDGFVLILPAADQDPIFQLGMDPIDDDITDASERHDEYIYKR